MRPTPRIPRAKRRYAKSSAKGRSRLGGRLDVSDARDVQCDRGCKNDEVCGRVGIKHAAPRILRDSAQFARRRGSVIEQWRRARHCAHVLNLFRCLPKEKVRADGGAENGDDHSRRVSIEVEARPEGAQHDFAPGDVNCKQHSGIGQQ